MVSGHQLKYRKMVLGIMHLQEKDKRMKAVNETRTTTSQVIGGFPIVSRSKLTV